MKQSIAPVSLAAVALGALSLAGCATKSPVVADLPPPPPVVAVQPPVPMPAGAYPGMKIPARLADGRYDTPNIDLTPDAATWHFRVALNVAALACRGAEGDSIVAGYNALLTREKGPLATAEHRYAAEYQAKGGKDWRDSYDDAMTRLYNFFSQSPARAAFCDAAQQTLSDAAFVDDAALPGFAAGRLAVLEKPFTDFYRAYDAWRADRARLDQLAMASMPVPAGVRAVQAVPAPTPVARPRLELDMSALVDSTVAH